MKRYPAYRCALRTPALAVILVTFIIRPVLAATSNWTTDTGGDFSNSANWDNGVPAPPTPPSFAAGMLRTTCNLTGDIITDKLRVGTNTVNFKPSSNDGTYSLANLAIATDKGIIVGELSNDTAVLNSRLPAFTASVRNDRAVGRIKRYVQRVVGRFKTDWHNIRFYEHLDVDCRRFGIGQAQYFKWQ